MRSAVGRQSARIDAVLVGGSVGGSSGRWAQSDRGLSEDGSMLKYVVHGLSELRADGSRFCSGRRGEYVQRICPSVFHGEER